jgi:hypothetical protein
MTDPFTTYDAGYLLGALTPADRATYEEHLAECPDCRAAVNQLAGLPGLLASVSPAQAAAIGEELPDVPETLLPRLLAEVQAARFRRRMTTVLGAVAAAVVLVVAVVVGIRATGPDEHRAQPGVVQKMEPVSDQIPIRATARLDGKTWGTRVVITCVYKDDTPDWGPFTYTMAVTDDQGRTDRIATWEAQPGAPVVVDGSTSMPLSSIRSVDVLGPQNQPVLSLKM